MRSLYSFFKSSEQPRLGDFDRSLGSRYFVCVVNERASFASFACAVEGAR